MWSKGMSENRDTQFQCFAKSSWRELEASIDFIPEGQTTRKTFLPMVEGILARHAYALVQHTLEHCVGLYDKDVVNDISDIPDMPTLPEEKE
jgi:hypothetical protein